FALIAALQTTRAARGPPLQIRPQQPPLVGDSGLRVWRIGRVLLRAADQLKRGVERLVVLRIRRVVGLRAGLLVAFCLQMAAQRSFALRVGPRLELVRYLLKHFDVRYDALGLDRAAGRREVARRGQPQ